MPINPTPTYPEPAMSLVGVDKLYSGALLTPNELRSLQGLGPHGAFRRRPFECISCGAVLKLSDAECSYCQRPNPDHDHSLGAMIEVTSLDDPSPRYVPGWAPPRPLPPAGRLVLESGRHLDAGAQAGCMGALTVGYGVTDAELQRVRRSWDALHMGPIPRKPRRRLVEAVLSALGLR